MYEAEPLFISEHSCETSLHIVTSTQMQGIFRFHCSRERCTTYFRINIMSRNEKNIGTMQTNINFVQIVTRTSVHLHADYFRFIKHVVVL